jgi:hypothetical protein
MADFKVASAYADFEVRVDEGIDKAKARIKQRAKELDTSARVKLDIDVKDAKANLRNEFKDERFTVKADADTTLARARLEKLTGEGTFKIRPDVDDAGVRRAASKMDSATSKMAERANAQFDAMKFTAFTVGLPAAAAAGATLAVGAVAALPIAFGGAVAMLTSQTDEVSSAWGALADGVSRDAKGMAQQFTGSVVTAIDGMGAAWTRLRPAVQQGMALAAPLLQEAAGAATDLAEGAMPGVITAMNKSGVAMDAVRTFAGQAGAGISDFFANASKGVDRGSQGFVIFGGTIQTVLSRAGELAANLANLSGGPLRSLDTIVNQVTGSLVDLTSEGSGAVGVLQGFGTVGSGLATILRGVSIAIAALPPGITEVGGSIAATAMIASKFGVDVGAGFEGLGKKVKDASGATGKFKAGFTGLAEGLLNPATIAVTALGIGLNVLGQQQEIASQYAAQHRDNVRSLTQAIREDNGVLGENVKQANIKALTDKNATSNLATFGATLGDAKLAIEGNTDAYDRLNYSARAQLDTIGQHAQLSQEDRNALKDLGTESLKTGKNFEQLTAAGGRGAQVAQMLGGAWNDNINSILNANGAVGEQINSQKQAMDAYYQSESALTGLSEAQIRARDSTIEHTKATQDAIGGELGYRGAVQATKEAIAGYTKVNNDHKASEDQKAQALLGAENAMYRQIQAAGQAAAANANVKSENERAMVATQAMNRETVNLANTWQGPLPASLQAGIAKMDISSARAAGLTVAIDNTGKAVYRLPNGKTIAIESTADQQRAKVDALQASIQALRDRNIKITVDTFYGTSGRGQSLTGPAVARAQGGLVGRLAVAGGRTFAGGVDAVAPVNGGIMGALGRSIRDSIPSLLAPGEAVTNSQQTARNYRELQAINNGQRNYEKYPDTGRPPTWNGQMPAQRTESPTIVNLTVNPPADMDVYALAQMVSREIMLRGK